jgi:hypothetical protein
VDIEEIIRRIIEFLRELEQAHRDFAARIREAAAKFFQDQAQQFEAMLTDIANRLAPIVAEVERQLAQVGDPVRLHEVGVTWSKSVGAPASMTGGDFDLNTLLTDDEWAGIAADAYKSLVPSQKTAFDAVKAVTDKLQQVLDDVATGIVVAWGGVLGAVASFVSKIIAAAVTAATGVGAPAAIGIAVEAVMEFGGLITAIFATLGNFFTGTAMPATRTLNQSLTDNSAFPNGAWPTTTSNIRDSSFRDVEQDEDESHINWHMRRA